MCFLTLFSCLAGFSRQTATPPLEGDVFYFNFGEKVKQKSGKEKCALEGIYVDFTLFVSIIMYCKAQQIHNMLDFAD